MKMSSSLASSAGTQARLSVTMATLPMIDTRIVDPADWCQDVYEEKLTVERSPAMAIPGLTLGID